jgi:hypothetical protein
MKLKDILLITSCLFCSSFSLSAQTDHFPLMAINVNAIPITNDSTTGTLPELTDSTIFKTDLYVSLFDTVNITKLLIKIKEKSDTSVVIFQKNFDFDVYGTLSDSTSYNRNEYQVELGLGNITGLIYFLAEVRIERSDGSLTEPLEFSR